MRRILFYFLLGASVMVFAQQQITDNEEAAVPAGEAAVAAPDGVEEAQDPPGAEDTATVEDLAGEMPVDADIDEDEAPLVDPRAETGPGDSDFKPDEEISEDYPVPLPSDI